MAFSLKANFCKGPVLQYSLVQLQLKTVSTWSHYRLIWALTLFNILEKRSLILAWKYRRIFPFFLKSFMIFRWGSQWETNKVPEIMEPRTSCAIMSLSRFEIYENFFLFFIEIFSSHWQRLGLLCRIKRSWIRDSLTWWPQLTSLPNRRNFCGITMIRKNGTSSANTTEWLSKNHPKNMLPN